jgi:hypothetical protein
MEKVSGPVDLLDGISRESGPCMVLLGLKPYLSTWSRFTSPPKDYKMGKEFQADARPKEGKNKEETNKIK